MCYCKKGADVETVKKCLDRTHSRGPDQARVQDIGAGVLGFGRLAVMGLTESGMQPFSLNGNYVVCNGEIYGYKKIRQEMSDRYSFASDSDCEVLLPLYEEFKTDMFRMLDAEFACVIYDGKEDTFIAARDPIGIRPLYYGYNASGNIVFAGTLL